MTITQSYNGVAHQARTATERSVDIWKRGATTIIGPVDLVSNLPSVDLTWPVKRYFEYAQQAVELNRDLATAWAETVMSLFGVVREHAEKVSRIVKDETETVADLAREQAEQVEQAAREQAEKAEQAEQAERDSARRARQAERERAEEAEEAERAKAREAKRVEREEARKAQQRAEEAEEAERAKAREAKRVEREEARKAQQQAREAYEGLTKAELSDQLAGRGLPKTGNIEDLIERLVSADSE